MGGELLIIVIPAPIALILIAVFGLLFIKPSKDGENTKGKAENGIKLSTTTAARTTTADEARGSDAQFDLLKATRRMWDMFKRPLH